MLITKKKGLLFILATVFLSCAIAFAALSFGAKTSSVVKAGSPNLYVEDEVYVRLTEAPYGLRFTLRISNSLYEEVVTDDVNNEKQIGAIIIPYSYAEDYDAYVSGHGEIGYHEYLINEKDGKMIDLTTSNEADWFVYDDDADNYKAYVAVTDILFENVNEDFVCIAYVRTETSGNPVIYSDYTTPVEEGRRSISTVAKSYLASDEESNEYIDEMCATGFYQGIGVEKNGDKYFYDAQEYDSLSEIEFEFGDIGEIEYVETWIYEIFNEVDPYFEDYSGDVDLYQGDVKLATFKATDGAVDIDIPMAAEGKETSFTLNICGIKLTYEAFGYSMIISDADEFLEFVEGNNSTYKYGYYVLEDNIDLDSNGISAPFTNGSYTAGFAGELDGQGYVVYNAKAGNGNFGGVFGQIAPSGVIQNIGIANLYLAYTAYNSGLPNTALCFTNCGTLRNVSVSFTYDDSRSSMATPAFIYCSNAATYENVVVESYNYSAQAAAIANFKPFVMWNRTTDGDNTFNNVYVVTNSENTTELTGVTYYGVNDEKTFDGITDDIWDIHGDVMVMAQEKEVLAIYTVKHYIDISDLTYARDVEIHRANIGAYVTGARKTYPQANGANQSILSDVLGYEAYEDVLEGTAAADGSLELKAYYYAVTENARINGNNNLVFKSNNMRTQATSDGSWKHSITKDYKFAPTKEDVYKFVTYTGYSEWYGRFMTTGFNYASLTGKTMVFEIYIASSSGAFPYIYINHDTAGASTYKLNGTGKAINNAENSLCVYDASGNLVSSVSAGAWYTVVIDGDQLTATQPIMELCLGANSTFYIANMHFEDK